MGQKSGLSIAIDGYLNQKVDLQDNSTEIEPATSNGKVRGVIINQTLSAHITTISDGSGALFEVPASMPGGSWIPAGDLEYLGGLTVDPDDATSAGDITIVYNPYAASA